MEKRLIIIYASNSNSLYTCYTPNTPLFCSLPLISLHLLSTCMSYTLHERFPHHFCRLHIAMHLQLLRLPPLSHSILTFVLCTFIIRPMDYMHSLHLLSLAFASTLLSVICIKTSVKTKASQTIMDNNGGQDEPLVYTHVYRNFFVQLLTPLYLYGSPT